jgi:hypothetical protein
MDPKRTVYTVFNFKPYESRKTGRPKLRWEVGVLQDIRALDIRNWRDMFMRRAEWQRLPRKAKAQSWAIRASDDDDFLTQHCMK